MQWSRSTFGLESCRGTWGHASLQLHGGATTPGEYISWWPAGEGGVGAFLTDRSIPAVVHTFEQDDEAEGGANFHTINLSRLDEDAMRRWWAEWKSDLTFRLFHRSCATTVAAALATGNRDPITLSDTSFWTPLGVYMYAQQIRFVEGLLG